MVVEYDFFRYARLASALRILGPLPRQVRSIAHRQAAAPAKAQREGHLTQRLRFFTRNALLIVDEIGYLPLEPGGANLFFQLVNARYERGAMILTSNRGFQDWGEIVGDVAVASALLDRLLRHATTVDIKGESYRLKEKRPTGLLKSQPPAGAETPTDSDKEDDADAA